MRTDNVFPVGVIGLAIVFALQVLFPNSWGKLCAVLCLAAAASALYLYLAEAKRGDR